MNAGEPMGPYVIEAAIGEGGMGAVYRARDTRLDRTVALKVSKADFSDRFEREAKAVGGVTTPPACPVRVLSVGAAPRALIIRWTGKAR